MCAGLGCSEEAEFRLPLRGRRVILVACPLHAYRAAERLGVPAEPLPARNRETETSPARRYPGRKKSPT